MFLQKAWRTAAFGIYGYTQFTKSGFQSNSKKFKPEDMERRLEGKNCVVTGAILGLDLVLLKVLLQEGPQFTWSAVTKREGKKLLPRSRRLPETLMYFLRYVIFHPLAMLKLLHQNSLQMINLDSFDSGYEQRRKQVNKKYDIHMKQLKAAKRSGNRVQQDKVKDRAKFAAAKDAKSSKSKQNADTDDIPLEAPKKWRDYTVAFHFPEPTELTPPLLQLIEASFSYPSRPDFKLSNVDVGIDMGTRVAIVGPNGAGKSTLLNLLAGDLTPTEGEVRRSQKLRIGRYSQHFVDLLTMEETPVQYLLRLHPDQEGFSKQEAVRAKLGKFGLPSHNHITPIAKLSGGQKSRVVFTSISMSNPHILLLDEPTNHLDMQSIDALSKALEEFSGGVVLVSHDSRLISHVCEDEERSQLWIVDDGTVENFDGTFEDYKDELMKQIKEEVDE